jgi:T-complex protein 1 subunit theta
LYLDAEVTKTATIVLRGATQNQLDDLGRAVDDGVNVIKALTKDGRLLPGAGAAEAELSKRLFAFGEVSSQQQQNAIIWLLFLLTWISNVIRKLLV